MGDLATAPGVSRISLEPLSIDAVGRAGPRGRLDRRCRRAVPEHGRQPLLRHRGDRRRRLRSARPRSATQCRPARRGCPRRPRKSSAAAAVLGQRADVTTLVAVSGQTDVAVDECVQSGVLVGDDEGWAFRHEIARVAVEEALLPGQRRDLHARALGDAALDRAAPTIAAWPTTQRAPATGRPRSCTPSGPRSRPPDWGAHREAAAQYRIALRACPRRPTSEPRLLEALSYECYLTDQLTEAIAARQQAMELHELSGDHGGGRHGPALAVPAVVVPRAGARTASGTPRPRSRPWSRSTSRRRWPWPTATSPSCGC